MDTRVNIGRTVARERRRRGVTQEELAAHLGVSKAAVSKWELGQSLPDVSLLPRIAAYFSLTLDELFDWHDELSEEDTAALYAEVYALGGRDPAAAHERLRTLAAEHYSDANLLLMLASLLTVWAAGMATPFAPASAGAASAGAAPAAAADDAPADLPDASIGAAALPDSPALTDEALALIDRALEIASDPATLFLAQQQKATTLFQAGRHEEAASLLEPLVRRQDTGAPTMLLASAYRKLGRRGDALDLLQAERLRAASFVLSSLMQEVGMRDDAAFAQAAGAAARTIFDALDMGAMNPFFSVSMSVEVTEALRRVGEKDEALTALARTVEAVDAARTVLEPPSSPLWDRMAGHLDPARTSAAWAEHKARQADNAVALMRREIAELVASPAWRSFAGDDPRYQGLAEAAARLSGEGSC